ncbi:MupA/Atu3671 family FMN-dependent luciferase-like monooxygenase [Falsiphaeobacter marinintestinus]|uniref:MupA/Atu3671 family FMN-dependent luciferase-like monooxygenase n=1 Tax=Falsiphaeobacter marinintestinus TaxID=1492905 RepID=UPI0011B4FA92|nr:MupA/Atu3671 family FMN-dependent luciferase-like monooxygenase [Phaeobacter marinintestinus]
MTQFSCVVIGNESLLIGCSEALLDRGHVIRAVVSRDSDIRKWAEAKNLPVLDRVGALEDRFAQGSFDWLLSIANLAVIPDAVLAMPSKGVINFHDGPLPRYAGLNTPVWALINDETRYGVTWHMIEGGIDEGDILAQRMFDVAGDETAFSLNSKCYGAAMDCFGDVVGQLEGDGPERQKQDLGQRSYFGREDRPAAAGRIDFRRTAAEISALVRALDFGDYWNPLTRPKIDVAGRVLLVRHASPDPTSSSALPGTIVAAERDALVVATGDGCVRLGGFSDVSGLGTEISEWVTSGEVLASPTAEEADALSAVIRATINGEAHWRRALQNAHPVVVPLATGGGAPDWESVRLSAPDGVTGETGALAALVWALRSGGEEIADVALTGPAAETAAQQAEGYVNGWVPLQICTGDTLAELSQKLDDTTARLQTTGAFACDLIARDPAITLSAVPGIGLALGGAGPIAGTCATVAVRDSRVTLHVDRARLDEDTVELLAKRLETAMQTVIAGSAATIDRVNVLPASERRQILVDSNATARDYDRSETIHHAFETQVERTPGAIALVFEDQSFTYAELNARANAVAQQLSDLGVVPGAHVGLFVHRSPDLLIGALAILKAGAAYVPLDPAYPTDRLAHFVADSRASVILTQDVLAAQMPQTDGQVLVPVAARQDNNVDGGATADDLAYLIYTSGSTGTPKGVMVEHRNVANFFAGMDDRIDHDAGGVWLAVTSLSFDISVLELFWTIARGFKVVLTSEENRAVISNGPIAVSDRHIDFNLMYWGNDDGQGPKKYELLLEGAKFADAHGFNAVWTPERHFHAFGGPYPNPSVTGAAVAAVTENLSVRSGSCVAPLHHPARIAEEWAVIDNLTNGKAALGIASGWQPDDFILRPENTPPQNKPAMFETIEILRKLWRGEEVAFPKADGSKHSVITQPRPVSQELSVWVTTAGNPETWREAGSIGANVLTHLLGQSIDEVAEKIRIYHAALREADHDPAKFTVTLMLHTYLDETKEKAADIAREPMKDYLRAAAGLIKQYAWAFPAFKKPKGVSNAFEMDLGVLSEDELEAILDFAFERYFEDSGLFGTIRDALVRVEQLKRIGVDEIACLIDYGIAPDVVLEGLKPLARVLEQANAPSTLSDNDHSMAAQIIRHNVTHMQCTPSMARMIAMNDEARIALGHVQHLMLGGEALPGELVEDLRECTGAKIQNMYGPTETTIWSTTDDVAPGAKGIVNVGTPIANTSVYVLDAAGQPAPIGVPGELFIGGEGVTRGYWQRAELTDDRFLPDPFADEAGLTVPMGARMYRTGDLVRWRADGRIDFLGRTDHQVKLRGQRIELGEIETVMAGFPGVQAAVVIAREIGSDTRLVGYITTNAPVSDTALRDHLVQHLPDVMVPAHVVTLDAFPLTPNKKIDRKALPEPMLTRAASPIGDSAPVQGDGVEAQIAAIWSRILGVDGIRAEDNFFALGGHSLLAVQAHREIRDKLGRPDLSITDIFRFPTLSGLAGHLGSDAEPEAPTVDEPARADTMSKRRAMRDRRRMRTS